MNLKKLFGMKTKVELCVAPKHERQPYVVCKEVTYTQREIIWKVMGNYPELIVTGNDTPYDTLMDIQKWPHLMIDENGITSLSHLVFFDKDISLGWWDDSKFIDFTELICSIHKMTWKKDEDKKMAEYRKRNK